MKRKIRNWLIRLAYKIENKEIKVIPKKSVITEDSYEAAYYMIHGAKINEIKYKKIDEKRAQKRGLKYKWLISMTDIPRDIYYGYRDGYGECNVRQLKAQRLKLKKLARR